MEKENKNLKFYKADAFTVPNILTYLRIVLIAPFIVFFLMEEYGLAVVCLVFSGLSDCFDGLLARKLNQVTDLGKILDPIADKLTLIAVMVCMVIYAPSVMPVFIVLIIKDFVMLLGGCNLIKMGITPPSAEWYGKIATVVFYFSVSIIVFLKAVINYESFYLDIILLSLTSAMMIYALYRYSKIYLDLVKAYKEKNAVKISSKKSNQ